jgi:hypothetical protein
MYGQVQNGVSCPLDLRGAGDHLPVLATALIDDRQ